MCSCCCCSCCAAACCGACTGPYCMTYVSAIFTGVECVIFGILNIFYLMGYYCTIEPPQQDHLASGARFFEDVWSWFIYSYDTCANRFGDSYDPPDWIHSVPDHFTKENLWGAVAAYTGVYYQIVLIIMHILWFISCFVLIYGNTRRIPKYYAPWLIIGKIIFVLDIIFGSLYIAFMSKVDYEDDEWESLFSMIFYYFRGFIFVICNFFMICFVDIAFFKVLRKSRKEAKFRKEITLEINTTIVQESQPRSQLENFPVVVTKPQRDVLGEAQRPVDQVYPLRPPVDSTNPQRPVDSSYPYMPGDQAYPQNRMTPSRGATAPPVYPPPPYRTPSNAYNPAFLEDQNDGSKDHMPTNQFASKYQPFSYTNPNFPQENKDIQMSKMK